MSTEFELFTAIGNAFHRRGAATAKDRPLLTQILISRNLHQRCIITIFPDMKKIIKKMWWNSFFRIIPNSCVTFQTRPRQSNIEAADFFSSSTPISATEVHK